VVRQERGASYPAVRDKDILGESIPVPPLDEQQKIAAVLGKVQAAVAVEGDLVRVARELKQAALRQLFTRGLRNEPQKQTELGLVPKSWVEVRVDTLGEVVTGTIPKTAERSYYEGGTFDFIAPGDISIHGQEIRRAGKKITEAGMKKSRVLPKGTSCFVCIGSTIGKVGITTQERSATNQQINAVIPGKDFEPYFAFHTWLWNSEWIASRASPSPVPIMSLFAEPLVWVTQDPDEQHKIAKLLATLDAKIAHHEARQNLLRELFRTLLHDLLTARRRVTCLDLADHIADAAGF
jgi:type I restriction enzyme S subunit